MTIEIDIRKKLGDFAMEVSFKSNAKRIGILGASGCGKTMTLKMIAGIEKPDRGRIVSDGRVLFDSSGKVNIRPQKRNVGYMFQNYALFPNMTVRENIAAGLTSSIGRGKKTERYAGRKESADQAVYREYGPDVHERVGEMIRRFSLDGMEDHLPSQLSGGQQQRVALARIMAYSPSLIMLDEPFSALDQHLKERLQHEMKELLDDYPGQVIMVSHSRDEVYRFAEDLVMMDEGSVAAMGGTRKLFEDPGTVAAARMTGCKNITGIEKVDDHTMRIPGWGVTVKMKRQIPEGARAIGYRAHMFEPVWGSRAENCIPFILSGVDELPFERRYYLTPAAGHEENTICWFVQDNERRELDAGGQPDYLKLREEDIMFLR